uniref:Uncharacterized protein n=2 Tax=Helianthus annuus TaxID=4232 RepID=A0A251SNN5_HELAN
MGFRVYGFIYLYIVLLNRMNVQNSVLSLILSGFYHVISTKVLYPKTLIFFSLLSRNPVPFPSLVSDWRPELEFRRSPAPLFSDQHLFSLTSSSLSLLNYGRPPPIGGDIRQAAATPPPQAVALWWLTWRRQQRQRGVVDALKEAMAWTPVPRAVTNQNSDNSHTLLILLIVLEHVMLGCYETYK